MKGIVILLEWAICALILAIGGDQVGFYVPLDQKNCDSLFVLHHTEDREHMKILHMCGTLTQKVTIKERENLAGIVYGFWQEHRTTLL